MSNPNSEEQKKPQKRLAFSGKHFRVPIEPLAFRVMTQHK